MFKNPYDDIYPFGKSDVLEAGDYSRDDIQRMNERLEAVAERELERMNIFGKIFLIFLKFLLFSLISPLLLLLLFLLFFSPSFSPLFLLFLLFTLFLLFPLLPLSCV